MAKIAEPPYNEQAEQAVLGSLLIEPDAIAAVSEILAPEHFYIIKHQWIYEAMLRVYGKNEPVDLLTVSKELGRADKLDEAGGEPYIAALTEVVPTALHVETYAKTVAECALRRRVLLACSNIAQAAYDMSADAQNIATTAYNAIAEATSGALYQKRLTLDEACDALLAEIAAASEGAMPGAPTGIEALDKALSGLRPSRLYVVAGLPGSGKTTLMLSMLLAVARSGRRAAMWSLEMSEIEMLSVCASRIAGVSLAPSDLAMLNKSTRTEYMTRIHDAIRTIRNLPISLIAAPGITPSQIAHEVKVMKLTKGIDVIAADYIQLMRAPQMSRDATREQEVSAVAWGLKELAMRHDVAVIAGSQVNDDGQLRESRAIEQHADAVMVLTTTERMQTYRRVTATLRKNRGGPVCELNLIYEPAAARFGSVRQEAF